MPKARLIADVIEPVAVREGAGVIVRRSIAGPRLNYLDPFLLLDHFHSHDRADYEAGFPLHPHRGIETVTYVLWAPFIIKTPWATPEALEPEICNG